MYKKKFLLIVLCLGLIGIVFSRFETTMLLDRLNPFVHETISYAQVAKDTQKYTNVTIINPKTGKKLPYELKQVGGYDPDRQYIAIDHKGQYVRQIKYISKKQFMTSVNK